MIRFLPLIALFSLVGAAARPAALSAIHDAEGPFDPLYRVPSEATQPYRPTVRREPMRGPLVAAPTAAEAESALPQASRYLAPLEAWTGDGLMRKTDFTVPFAWANRQVYVHMGPAGSEYELFVNGKSAGYNADPNQPAEFNVTKLAHEGKNRLSVRFDDASELAVLESWKRSPLPAFDGAYVFSQPTMHIRDVLVRNRFVGGELKAEVGIVVRTAALNPKTSRIYYDLRTPDSTRLISGHQDLTLGMRGEDTLRFVVGIPDSLLWSADRPILCDLRLRTRYEGRDVEHMRIRLGFRSVETERGRLLVNGEPVELRIREIAPTTTVREVIRLREEGFNALKLHAGAVSEGFYAACDSVGIYVVVQAPIDTRSSGSDIRKGGNPSNDPAWLPAYLERVSDSYHATKRHPSVVAFSLAEGSANGINLYESYLELKRMGDSRPVIYPDAGGEWNSDLLSGVAASRGRSIR